MLVSVNGFSKENNKLGDSEQRLEGLSAPCQLPLRGNIWWGEKKGLAGEGREFLALSPRGPAHAASFHPVVGASAGLLAVGQEPDGHMPSSGIPAPFIITPS